MPFETNKKRLHIKNKQFKCEKYTLAWNRLMFISSNGFTFQITKKFVYFYFVGEIKKNLIFIIPFLHFRWFLFSNQAIKIFVRFFLCSFLLSACMVSIYNASLATENQVLFFSNFMIIPILTHFNILRKLMTASLTLIFL